jgi:hypothetical protein
MMLYFCNIESMTYRFFRNFVMIVGGERMKLVYATFLVKKSTLKFLLSQTISFAIIYSNYNFPVQYVSTRHQSHTHTQNEIKLFIFFRFYRMSKVN